MKKEELNNKVWYRFLKVSFYGLGILVLMVALFFANGKAHNQIQVLDEPQTYEAIGLKVRTTKIPWDGWKYPLIETSTNQEIGRAFYENRYTDPIFLEIWTNKKQNYEFYNWVDKYTLWQKAKIYIITILQVIITFFFLGMIGLYIITGKSK